MSTLRAGGMGSHRGLLAVGIFALAVGLVSAAGKHVAGNDDPRVAGIARGMALSGDYVVPRLNGRPFLEYPPLGYLPIALSLRAAGGSSDFMAFLPGVLLGVGTTILAARIGTLLAGPRVGTLAGILLASSSGYVSVHSSCIVDPSLLFWITLALWGFVAGRAAVRGAADPAAPAVAVFPRFALFYIGSAAALLSKGIIGLAVPLAVVGADIVIERDLTTLRRMRVHFGLLLFLLPIGLWAAAVAATHGWEPLLQVTAQSFWRGFSEATDHANPFWYYLTGHIFVVLMPATLVPLVAAWARWGPARRRDRLLPGPEAILPAVWLCVTLAGLSVASAKRSLYLAPLLPAGAILAALIWDRAARFVPLALRLERWFPPAVVVALAAFQLLHVIPAARRESLRPTLEVVSRERKDGSVILFSPQDPAREGTGKPPIVKESFSGAAVFYLGEVVPEVTDPAVLATRLASDPSRRWVVASYYKRQLPPLGTEAPPPGLQTVHDGLVDDRHCVRVYVRTGEPR